MAPSIISETVKKFDYHAGHCDVSDPDKGQVEPLLLIQRGKGDHAPRRVKQDHGLVGDKKLSPSAAT